MVRPGQRDVGRNIGLQVAHLEQTRARGGALITVSGVVVSGDRAQLAGILREEFVDICGDTGVGDTRPTDRSGAPVRDIVLVHRVPLVDVRLVVGVSGGVTIGFVAYLDALQARL